ncbi:hypothetical protein [Nostoc sp. UHCC 0302]|uniref:hypothetical protein n=1 Tax=Nostoc sp. UHCC 0302 TaxID=3134896 RepID=UPI00311CCC12
MGLLAVIVLRIKTAVVSLAELAIIFCIDTSTAKRVCMVMGDRFVTPKQLKV